MDGTLYYYIGGALVLAALVVSAIGIRRHDSWPSSRGAMIGITALFAALVIGTTAYAVANAREEQAHHREERAEAEEHAAEAEGAQAVEEAPAEGQAAPPGGAPSSDGAAPPPETPAAGSDTTLQVSSPADGSLVFEPDTLSAPPGSVTLVYENPSPVPHNIALEDGEVLAESETIAESEASITSSLEAGELIYFCAVPGHREAGMEGTLTVE